MIDLTKNEEEITKVSLSKLENADDKMKNHVVNLSKTIVNLSKSSGVDLGNHTARVCLVLDYSGSMDMSYSNGSVQEVINRMIPFGLHFDDNGEIETFIFHDRFAETETITSKNYSNYVKNCLLGKYEFGGTIYWPVLKAIENKYFNVEFGDMSSYKINNQREKTGFLSKIFGKKKVAETTDIDMKTPVFVIFITDGVQYKGDNRETNRVIREMSKYNVFIQFIGCGGEEFKYLKELDNLDGRECDNTGFVKFSDIKDVTDEELYNKVLEQYPEWLKAKGIK